VVDEASHFPNPHIPHEGGRMAISVYIPTPFRKLTGNRQNVEADGKNVAEVLAHVDRQYPGFRQLVFGEGETVPAHINIYVNKQEIGSLNGIETALKDGDEVAVIPALAGGAEGGGPRPPPPPAGRKPFGKCRRRRPCRRAVTGASTWSASSRPAPPAHQAGRMTARAPPPAGAISGALARFRIRTSSWPDRPRARAAASSRE
jgi:MoaD family protein